MFYIKWVCLGSIVKTMTKVVTYIYLWGWLHTGAATVESSMGLTQKIKNGSAFWPSDPTSGNIPKETQNTNSKEHEHPYVHCSVFYNHHGMEEAHVSISGWVGKTTMGCLHSGILLDHKKRKFLFFARVWMNLENIMLSEISQSEKEKITYFTHMWNLMNKLN